MRYFAIANDFDTLSGLRLAGIEGGIAGDRREMEALLERVSRDEQIAVLLVTRECAALCPETIAGMKLSARRPLVVEIPGADGPAGGMTVLTDLIRDAIGVKI